MQGVYRIRNITTGKYYVGSTECIERRFKEHKSALNNGKHINRYLQFAWDKYGEEDFIFEIVEKTKTDLKSREQLYLDVGFELGLVYNLSRDASAPMRGRHLSDESKEKVSRARAGRQASEATKQKISMGLKGHVLSNETKQKISEANKGYPKNKGKHHSEEAKQKISNAQGEPYPAFYNIETNQYIPAGSNLRKLCKSIGLKYDNMLNIKNNNYERTRDGWMLVLEEER